MSKYNGIHMTSKSGGPCWSRDRGYHTPAPLPTWFWDDVSRRRKQAPKEGGKADAPQEQKSDKP